MTPATEIAPPRPPRPWTLGRIHLPQPAMGDLYRRRGIAWGALLAPHKRGNPSGGPDLARLRREV